MSILDPLPGLSNRRNFSRAYADEMARVQRTAAPLSLIFLDPDRFKNINGNYSGKATKLAFTPNCNCS